MGTEEKRDIRIGAPIPGEKVQEGLTIGKIIDPPTGHLLVDAERSSVHVYWYNWIKEGDTFRKRLTHHGGERGFGDIQTAIDQAQIVISRYMGVETKVDSPVVDDPLLKPPVTLRTYAQAFRIASDRMEIPGERAWVNDCVYLIDRTIRGAAIKMPASELNARLSSLVQLQPKFDRAKNPHMQQAAKHLVEIMQAAQEENRDQAMVALLSMSEDVMKRAVEISDILEATIRREALLEHQRNSMEDVVRALRRGVADAKFEWDNTNDPSKWRQIVLRLNSPIGVSRLSELTIQPFRGHAKKKGSPLLRLGKLIEYFSREDWETIGRVLTDSSTELIQWEGKIEKRVEGELDERYPDRTKS